MATESEQYEAFTELARSYCAAIEDPAIRGVEGLRTIHNLLLPLHAVAIQLPDVDLPEVRSDQNHKSSFDDRDSLKVGRDLQDRLPLNIYWDIFDPLKDPPDEMVAGSLSNDLSEIWDELKEGLVELQTGGPSRAEVWWEWRFGFYTHWGAHSADALRVMYYALRDS